MSSPKIFSASSAASSKRSLNGFEPILQSSNLWTECPLYRQWSGKCAFPRHPLSRFCVTGKAQSSFGGLIKSVRRSVNSSGSATNEPMTNIPPIKGQAIKRPNGGLVFFLSSASAALMDAANIIVFRNIFSAISAKGRMFQNTAFTRLLSPLRGGAKKVGRLRINP